MGNHHHPSGAMVDQVGLHAPLQHPSSSSLPFEVIAPYGGHASCDAHNRSSNGNLGASEDSPSKTRQTAACPEDAVAECRICQEEEDLANLENPCACSGSVKYAHRKCVQRWCNEKGDTTCEICRQPYKSGYTAPPSTQGLTSNDVALDFSDEWNSHTIELHDPRLLAMAAAQRRFLDAQYEEANSSSAACCRSAALILMALLLLRHAIAMASASVDEDASMFFTLFVLRAAGFLLPCYIMARAINMLQRRRQRQEAAVAATEVAIFLQAGQSREVHLSISPGL